MTTYGTGVLGYKKFCDERIDFLDMLKKEKLERKKLLGLLKQEEIDAINNKNRSIERQWDLDEMLRKMKEGQTGSLNAVKEQMRKQELEDQKKQMIESVRKKIKEEREQ